MFVRVLEGQTRALRVQSEGKGKMEVALDIEHPR